MLINVLCVPSLHFTVLSRSQLDEREIVTEIAEDRCTFYHRKQKCGKLGSIHVNSKDRLYQVPIILPTQNRSMDVAIEKIGLQKI